MDPTPANGLRPFAFHAGQSRGTAGTLTAYLDQESAAPASALDPETVARLYVKQALQSGADGVRDFETKAVDGRQPKSILLGIEKILLAGTQTVKFRQTYRGIPVYGSLVTIEVDEDNRLLAISSALGEPTVDPVAEFSVKDIVAKVRAWAGYPEGAKLDVVPKLHYYYAPDYGGWCMVDVAEDVPKYRTKDQIKQHDLPEVNDYVVCAHTGKRVAELPRTMTADGGGGAASQLRRPLTSPPGGRSKRSPCRTTSASAARSP